jgi:hypothetical protein
MPATSSPPTADALLAHAEWIRALASSLVRDPDTADEIVQRTLVAAWTRPPKEPGSLRGWLVRCLQNFAHGARRSSERRDRSEAFAARQEALPSAHDVVERASVSRELVEHVLALDEPYRTAILPLEYGRYVEGDARFARTKVRELPLERIESLEIVVDRRAHVHGRARRSRCGRRVRAGRRRRQRAGAVDVLG